MSDRSFRDALGDDGFAAAWAEGQAMPVAAAAAHALGESAVEEGE